MSAKTPDGPPSGAGDWRVGINAHLLTGESGYRRAGIHQYILQNLRHLAWEEDGPEYLLFTRQAAELEKHRPDIQVIRSRWPTERRLVRLAWEQMAWPALAARLKLDLLHSMAFVTPALSPCPTVVTVYDLSFIHFPDSFPALQRLYLRSQTARSCRQARRVIAISESGRQDIHQLFGVELARIDVVRPGVDEIFRPLPATEVASFRRRRKLSAPFILHVGTLQPRKNIPLLLEAFAHLKRPDLQLVLLGGKGWMFDEIYRRVETLGLRDQVRFTGYVPDADLPFWYNAATLFVFPSIYEGFGMPVVEAMACGTPVVAANTSSIPEAAGDAASLFPPQDAEQLADRMLGVLQDEALLIKMQAMGLQQARQFSWRRAGRETAAVHRKALLER